MAEFLDAVKMCSPVCRLCLGKEENYAPIFENLDLPNKMKYCVEVEASPSDGLTSVICLPCLENVERFFCFKKMCADSQLQLRKISKESENPMKVVIVPGSISSGETAKDSGVDWSTEEASQGKEVGDPVTSTSAEDEKLQKESSGGEQQRKAVMFPENFESEAADPDRESSDGVEEEGEWENGAEGEEAEKEEEESEDPSGEERGGIMTEGIVVKQEVVDEEEEVGDDDYVMDESFNSAVDENGELEETEEPPWDKPPSLEDIPSAVNLQEGQTEEIAPADGEPAGNSDLPVAPKKHICKHCNQCFVKRHQLYGHLATHSRKGGHSKASTSRVRSTIHYNRPPSHTRAWLMEKQKNMKFTCIDCNEEFLGVPAFTSHKGIHRQNDKKFHCSVCNHIYPRAIDLIFHEWTYHTGDRPFPCNKCPSAFARQTSWTYHILAHISNNSRTLSSRSLRDTTSAQPAKRVVSPVKTEVVGRRTMAPRRAALEGRAAAQMGSVAISSATSFPFKCRTCGKGILNEETWEYHLVIHPEGGETRQNLSLKDLESLRAQLRQAILCENKTKLACLQCGLECIGIQGLANHKYENHFSKGGYKCSVCYKGVGNVHKFIRHEMSHTKVKIYVCENCGREMADRMSFVRHIIAHFNEPQFETPTSSSSNQQLANPEAMEDVKENSFDQLVQKLLGPIKAHLKQELAPCLQCGQVFEGIQRLVVHKESHSNNSAGSHPHACWVCTEAFETAKALVEHEWSHTDVKPYGCDKCDQKFSAKDAWVNHLRSHFPSSSGGHSSKMMLQPTIQPFLKRRRMGSNDSPQTAVMTSPPFQNAGSTALRPFACGQCKSIFLDAESLESHAVQAHGMVHPFKCKICGKGYRLLLRLMHHESSVHPQLMGHPCEYCEKSFSDPSHLKLHSHLIHGDGPYMCDVCGKRFRMVGHLKIHRNMHNSAKDKQRGKASPFMGQASTSSVDSLEYSEFDVFD